MIYYLSFSPRYNILIRMGVIKSKYVILISIIFVCEIAKATAVRRGKRVDNSNKTDNTSQDKTATYSSVKTDTSGIYTSTSGNRKTETSSTQGPTISNQLSTCPNQVTTERSGISFQTKETGKTSILPISGLRYSDSPFANYFDIKNGTSNYSGSRFSINTSGRNQTANDSGSRFIKDSNSRDQTSMNSGSRFQEPTSSYIVNTNINSTEYVETEVVNFKRVTTINPDENLTVAECTKGQFAPRSMKIYKNDLDYCNLACNMGCEMGYGMYAEDPNYVPLDENQVTCYLIKVQANYRIKRFQKVSRKGKLKDVNECHCGTYFGPAKFRYCKTVNPNYASPSSHPLILKHKKDGNQRLACMNFCNEVTSFISLKGGKPVLVDCWPHHTEQTEIAWRTYSSHGQCIQRNGDTKCICGIPKYHKATLNWEETLKRPKKKFRYVLNMTASVREKDDRIYDLARLIYAPRFFVPIERNLRDGSKSSTDKPLNYKRTKPSIVVTTSDMTEGEKELALRKRSVETIHDIFSVAPQNVERSYNEREKQMAKDKDSVNPLAVRHSWISECDSELNFKYNTKSATTDSNSLATPTQSNAKATTVESHSQATPTQSNAKATSAESHSQATPTQSKAKDATEASHSQATPTQSNAKDTTEESHSQATPTQSNAKDTTEESNSQITQSNAKSATAETNSKTTIKEPGTETTTTKPNTKKSTEPKYKSNAKLKKKKNLKKNIH